jgi:hypothetical protein
MASIQQTVVFPATALTATTNGTAITVVPRSKRFIGSLVVSSPSGTVTVAAKIQHSRDGTNGWTDWLTFTTTAAGATADAVAYPTADAILPYARAVITLGGAVTTATVAISLYSETFAQ